MGLFTKLHLTFGSEKSLRKKELKLRKKLDKLDYDSKKHTKVWKKQVDYVNAISSKSKWKRPRREHGWNLYKED